MPYDSVIDEAARANGLDPAMLRRFSQIESGGDPNNRTGSYKGLFQLSDDEYANHGGRGNIYDPVENANAAARKIATERAAFKSKYGRDADATDIYLTHQQGAGGYDAHMSNPDAPAWENMVGTGEGRQKGDRWAKQAIWGNIPDDIKRQFPGGVETVTSKDFRDIWDRKVNGGSFTATPMASAFAAEEKRNMTPIEAALAQARAKQRGAAASPDEDNGILTQMAQQYAPGIAPYLPSADTADRAALAFSMLRDSPAATAAGVAAYNAKQKDSDVQNIAHGDNLIQISKRSGKVLGITPLPKVEKPDTYTTFAGKDGSTYRMGRNSGNIELVEKGDTPGEKKADEAFGKEYTDWNANGGIQGAERNINQMRGLIKELRDSSKWQWNPMDPNNKHTLAGDILGPTGAINGLMGDTAKSIVNPGALELQNRARDLFQQTARQVLGSQYTEKEGNTQFASNYDGRLSPEVNAANLEKKLNAMEKVARAKQAASDHFAKNGTLRGHQYAAPSFDSFNDDTPDTAAPASGNRPPLSTFKR